MLTRLIEGIIEGKEKNAPAEQQLIHLGVAKLPNIEKDNTDRKRTSPFAFTGNKFEFRAGGSSASIAFPIVLLNAAVAEAIEELTAKLEKQLESTKNVDDAVLAVVREAFRESASIRFEGNGYSDEWVKQAESRGLLNLRRTPEALAQLRTAKAKSLLTGLGILNDEELHSRYHVRLERYAKDMLIELHTLREVVDTIVLPASYQYSGQLAAAAAQAKAAGISRTPQVAAANEIGELIESLTKSRDALIAVTARAEGMHEDVEAQATLLTGEAADTMLAVRAGCDALEGKIADDCWPLPKYREMLFPG
jgi:glutamine synthetase